MPTTLADVANRCKVSVATVSRVLNNKTMIPISAETVARVRQVADEMNYRPNSMARALATGRTRTLGLYSREMTDPQFAQMLEAVEAKAAAGGYNVIVSSGIDSVVGGGRTDGTIVLGMPGRPEFKVSGRPAVFVFGAEQSLPDLVSWNDAEGIARATRHLIDLGHQSLVGLWCYGAEAHLPHPKVDGFRRTVRDAELIEVTECWESISSDSSSFTAQFESGRRAIARRLANGAPFTGVVARNDFLALGALRALREAGFSVPRDVSVVGYTDSLHALLTDPPLTSVRTPIAEAGEIAVERLLEAVNSSDYHFSGVSLPTELVVRESTGPAPI